VTFNVGLAMVGLVGRAVVPAGAGMDVDVAMVARAVVVEEIVEIVEMVAVVARAAVGVMVGPIHPRASSAYRLASRSRQSRAVL